VEGLRGVDLLIIGAASNALAPEEASAVDAWVQKGGSLLLLTDHEPFASPARGLAGRLGVGMSLELIAGTEPGTERRVYPVRGAGSPRPLRVRTYGGQALWRESGTGSRLLPLEPPITTSGGGVVEPPAPAAQLLSFEHGEGRVVVSGDSGLFTAQRNAGGAVGVSDAAVDNQRFVVGILRWLLRQKQT
jgi:hypothetical protein